MKKRPKKRQERPTTEIDSDARDRSLFRALREAFEWAIDVAAGLARDYPEEVESVERLRAYLRARLSGNPGTVPINDVLFVLALLISAIERGCGALGMSSANAPSAFHLPGAETTSPHPRVFIHSWPRARSPYIGVA